MEGREYKDNKSENVGSEVVFIRIADEDVALALGDRDNHKH